MSVAPVVEASPRNALGKAMDDRTLNAFQWRVLVLCGCVAAIDGFDTQLIGYTGRLIAHDIGFADQSLGLIISLGLLGATVGALILGRLADSLGRKPVLVAATLIMGVATLLTVFATNYAQLAVLRFVAGLALGGAAPCFIVLALEFSAPRLRSTVSGALYAAFPGGGAGGALLSSLLLAHHDWRAVFLLGSIIPLVLSVLLLVFLPESLPFLISRGAQLARPLAIMRRLLPDKPESELTRILRETVAPHRSVRAPSQVGRLFREGRLGVTSILWVLFPIGFASASLLAIWTAPLLQRDGVSAAGTGLIVAAVNAGAVVGSIFSGALFQRFGRHNVLALAFLMIAGAWFLLAWLDHTPFALTMIAVVGGFFVGIGSAGLVVVAANAYPAMLRGTGVGWAMGTGRFGQAVAPLAVGALLATAWPSRWIFSALAVPALLGIVAVGLLGRTEARARSS